MGAGLALVAAGSVTMFAPRSAQADAQPFPLSQYVSSTSTTVCNANPVITTYHGTVVLDIPITALLAGHEAEIRAAAAQGLSPHDSSSDYNSDIALTVSVPEPVTLGESRATSTSSMLTNTWFSPNSDHTQVTANIQFKDLSWQQLLDIFDAEKANPGQHTIKVQVPYAVGTIDPAKATQLASEQVTVTGTFNFFASSTTPAQIFNFDTKTLALAQSPTDCFATRKTRWVDEEDGHDLQPPKTGPNFFQAARFPDYEFSTHELSADGLTGIYKYKKVFGSLPVNGDDPTIDTDFKVGLEGNTPTQAEKIYAESKDSLLTIENVVHLNDLRGGRIAKLLEKYDETPNAFDEIALKNAHLGFTTQITLPAQLKFSDPSAISVTGLPQGFSAKTVAVNGQTATVTVDFDNPDEITTIAALKDAMGALHGDAVITIQKIAFTESATADTDYQIDHLTQGTISVDVEKQLGVIVMPGQPSPACPPTMDDYDDYDAVKPAEPRSVVGTVFDPPSPACPPTDTPYTAGWRPPMTGPSAGWDEAPLMKHPLKFTTSEAHPDVTRFSFKPGPTPTPTPTTATPSAPPTSATQLAKTGALTGDVLVLATVTGAIGAAAMRRKRS